MPRKSRNYFANTPYLIFQYGHNFQPCFFDSEDYQHFIDLLSENCQIERVELNAQQLFNNQFFLVLTATESQSIPRMLQKTCSKYGRYVNNKYQRSGSLWQGRHKACPVQPGQYLDKVTEFIRQPILPRQLCLATEQPFDFENHKNHAEILRDKLYRNLAIGDSSFQRTVINHKMVQVKKTIVPRTKHGLMSLLSDRPKYKYH
ncbi:transposase [Thalassotalea mangrovi]|uniref:Transposase IS200-like domain-containing protein n=1 Tax=Thalassotalea mangrovi TaxID=2572245 RepID=A0A4U1B367_9GAMM|nr:transposase [Thalassotalea mangrovi]TKB43536.1 hypothetical protein E8M12_14660 [Thalassotalea mangrovi]